MAGEPHYLEIVTPETERVCALYEATCGARFDAADPALGGARVARLAGGSRLGVRPPLREDEAPVTRVYLRVDDLDASTEAARAAGAAVAVEGMDLGRDHGRISIVLIGGVEHGLWEMP